MRDQKHVILCVDDDQDTLDMLRIALESGGYRVCEAVTAEDGLKKYKSDKPDLLIVDLMMEEVDAGTRFVTKLKAMGNTAPIYMLSSVGDSLGMQRDYSDLGLDGIFQKPVDPHTLLMTVKTKLGKK
jgi:two-component system response regulator ArlR